MKTRTKITKDYPYIKVKFQTRNFLFLWKTWKTVYFQQGESDEIITFNTGNILEVWKELNLKKRIDYHWIEVNRMIADRLKFNEFIIL